MKKVNFMPKNNSISECITNLNYQLLLASSGIFTCVPNELVTAICFYLNYLDLLSFTQSCKRFNLLKNNDEFNKTIQNYKDKSLFATNPIDHKRVGKLLCSGADPNKYFYLEEAIKKYIANSPRGPITQLLTLKNKNNIKQTIAHLIEFKAMLPLRYQENQPKTLLDSSVIFYYLKFFQKYNAKKSSHNNNSNKVKHKNKM